MSTEQILEKVGMDEPDDRNINQANAHPTGGISFADPKPPPNNPGGRDLGLRRELTQDEKQLANAGYEELESKMKATELKGVSADIVE
jgi:hypothetical protein